MTYQGLGRGKHLSMLIHEIMLHFLNGKINQIFGHFGDRENLKITVKLWRRNGDLQCVMEKT